MEITEKHVEQLIGHKIVLLINLCGSVKGGFLGTIDGRLRNRFKHYVFTSDISHVNFFFTPHDVREIEQISDTFYVKLGEPDIMDSENKKTRKKKTTKSKISVKKSKTKNPVMNLNEPVTLSAQASGEKL